MDKKYLLDVPNGYIIEQSIETKSISYLLDYEIWFQYFPWF